MGLQNINNARVADNVGILPEQSFVDVFYFLLSGGGGISLNLSYPNISTPISFFSAADWLIQMLEANFAVNGTSFVIDFSGHAMDPGSIAVITGACVGFSHDFPTTSCTLNISGGSNAAPGAGDVTTLEGDGWTVIHN